MDKLKKMFGESLCFTEKVLYSILFFILLKIIDKKLHFENFLIFIGCGIFIFGLIFYKLLRRLNPDWSQAKAFLYTLFVCFVFISAIPLSWYYDVSNQKIATIAPTSYKGYLDSKRLYTDDVSTLLLLYLNFQILNEDERLTNAIMLFMTGKIHSTDTPLDATFYVTKINSGIVSFVKRLENGKFIRGYTFRAWTVQTK